MGVEKARKERLGERGQSALEFLFVLPLLVGMTLILIHVSSAIQVSIVEQKYARLAVHQFTFRSPKFPQRKFRYAPLTNQWVAGIQDESSNATNVRPLASEIKIVKSGPARQPGQFPSDSGAAAVLVRNSVTLCTQPMALSTGTMPSGLQEGTRFPFCKGAFE